VACCKHIPNIKKTGFTLVELLTVIAILGILVAVGVPVYQGYISNAERNVGEMQGKLDALGASPLDEAPFAPIFCPKGYHPCTVYSSDPCQNPIKGSHSRALGKYFAKLRCDVHPASIYCTSPHKVRESWRGRELKSEAYLCRWLESGKLD
jgi:prepilin-type N-terminal cleavage/methylation domain-containing protein